ncbi:MAG: hypothetical protein J5929_01955 [Eubacterium sp.]|nr:hypothetical protein [Eubacterium sp.]
MKKKEAVKRLDWAVVAECEAKNNGKVQKYEQAVALFDYPFLAQDYIDKCLPASNKDRFRVVPVETLSDDAEVDYEAENSELSYEYWLENVMDERLNYLDSEEKYILYCEWYNENK